MQKFNESEADMQC